VATSAFDIIIDKTLSITQGGQGREVTLDEALQHATYQAALAGSRPARTEILKMIAKREIAIAAKSPPQRMVEVLHEYDPDNANAALLILGIAQQTEQNGASRFKLMRWAVQAALSRRGRASLTAHDIDEAKRCTFEHDSIRWPKGSEE
jgi:hypothetical protein